jgi:hypothetical protein
MGEKRQVAVSGSEATACSRGGAASSAGAEGGARHPDLSESHNAPRKREGFGYRCHRGGSFHKIVGKGNSRPARVAGGAGAKPEEDLEQPAKRGPVRGFSRKSARTMRQTLAKVDRNALPAILFHIILTYPASFPKDSRVWIRHLNRLLSRLTRRYGPNFIIWTREPQRRLAPHFHLIVVGPLEIDRKWLSQVWYEIVASGDEKHLRAGVRIEAVNDWDRLCGYLSKRVGRACNADLPDYWFNARWWGIRGKLPIRAAEGPLEPETFYRVRRVMRKRIQKLTGRRIRIFGNAGLGGYMPEQQFRKLIAWGGGWVPRDDGGGSGPPRPDVGKSDEQPPVGCRKPQAAPSVRQPRGEAPARTGRGAGRPVAPDPAPTPRPASH